VKKAAAKKAAAKKPAAKKAATKAPKLVVKKASAPASDAPRLIDQRIQDLAGWRGDTLARMRALILEADPAMTEEWKWGVPVWSHDGIVCTGEAYQKAVKLTFAKGASVPDPAGLFNSSLTGGTRRAIDIGEGAKVDARAFKALIKAAVATNSAKAKKVTKAAPTKSAAKTVRLLSGGNPQVTKADGDAPVQEYISAMPGWKQDIGARLDSLIARNAPKARKAVKWNSPFYGIEGQGWFLSFHVFNRFVKVTFFNGASLKPMPPGFTAKSKETRWVDVYEDGFDEKQMAAWVKQAAKLPGWNP